MCLAIVPRNSIQTNLGLWWPLVFHLFFPPPRPFVGLLRFAVVGSSLVCIFEVLVESHCGITVVAQCPAHFLVRERLLYSHFQITVGGGRVGDQMYVL